MDKIRIAGVIKESIVDGPGLRYTIFTQGCAHRCPECHNPETWDFDGGYLCEFEKIVKSIEENPLLDGVTFSGGDPLFQAQACYELGTILKEKKMNIVVYTGYTFEELEELKTTDPWVEKLLSITDLLIDGRYDNSQRDLTLLFRGSKNQRVIDMNRTRESGTMILDERYI